MAREIYLLIAVGNDSHGANKPDNPFGEAVQPENLKSNE